MTFSHLQIIVTILKHTGWVPVARDGKLNYDLEGLPLHIKTDSEAGSDESVVVLFFNDQAKDAGGVRLFFTTPPQYRFEYCTISRTDLPTDLPNETDKIWTMTLHRDSKDRRVIVHCNEEEILNVVLSDASCDDKGWSNKWSREVEKIMFIGSRVDTASDFFRASQGEHY